MNKKVDEQMNWSVNDRWNQLTNDWSYEVRVMGKMDEQKDGWTNEQIEGTIKSDEISTRVKKSFKTTHRRYMKKKKI